MKIWESLKGIKTKLANGAKGVAKKIKSLSALKEIFGAFSMTADTKKVAIAVIIAITGFFIASHGLGRNKGEVEISGAEEPPAPRTDILTIIQYSPSGPISSGDSGREIVVVYNQPIIPLATLKKTARSTFQISPPIKGKFKWHGSRVNAFIPEAGYDPGTRYTVTVPAGLQAINGMKLEKEFSFTFQTPPLQVSSVSPYRDSDIEYEKPFVVRFNYPVSPQEVKKYTQLTAEGQEHPFKITYNQSPNEEGISSSEAADRKKSLEITPAKPFPRDAKVVLSIRSGLLPMKGNMGLEKDYNVTYKTYGPLHVKIKGSANTYEDTYSIRMQFNNPIVVKELGKALQLNPPAEFRDSYYPVSTSLSVSQWRLKPDTYYDAVIPAGFKDAYGNTLAEDKTFKFYVPNRRRDFSAKRGFLYVESAQYQRTPLTVTGVSNIQAKIGEVTLADVQDYAASDSYYSSFDFSIDHTLDWKTGLKNNQSARLGFDLSPYLDEKQGWLGVEFSGSVQDWSGRESKSTQLQFVQSTDLGIVVKEASTQLSYAWVHSLSTGDPVSGAIVDSYFGTDKVDSCTTDKRGYCSLGNKIADEGSSYRSEIFYVASHGKDKAFVMARQHALSMYGISPHYSAGAAKPVLSGQVIFDRKLYRPGDEIFFKAVAGVRREGKIIYDGAELGDFDVIITNSRGKVVYDQTEEAGPQGGISGSYYIPEDAPLGHYTVKFMSHDLEDELGKNSYNIRFSDTFQVEEFRPVNFSVSSEGFEETQIETPLDFEIEGKYLFGAPMQKAPYNYTINRKPENLYIANYSDFTFGDDDTGYTWEPPSWSYYTSGSGKLDAVGKARLQIETPVFPPRDNEDKSLSRIYRLELEARVSDVDDKTVTHRKEIMVTPGPQLPGLKIKDRYQSQDKSFEFEALLLNKDSFAPEKGEVEISIYRKEWNSVQTKGPGGSVQRKNTLVRTQVYNKTLQVSERGAPFSYKVKKAGNYSATIKVKGSKAYARLNFYAYGSSYVGWNFRDDDSLTLLPDKIDYQPGDTAKVLIQSPFQESTAIITAEREGVIWQKSFKIEGNGQPIEIPITEDFIPNVYLGVTLVRPRTAVDKEIQELSDEEDMGRPKLKAGVINLKVQNSAKRLPLSVKTDRETYQPGEVVTIEIQSEPEAEIALSVADRGVLDLVSYYFGDPVSTFYGSWPHGVRILENRHALIKQLAYANKGRAPGGKGWTENKKNEGGFDDDSEDGMRKDFRHTAYWNPSIITDKSGKALIEVQLPHNLTTFRIQAMAAKDGKYNAIYKEFKVQKPVIMQTLLPRFIRPGDTLEMGGVIVNQSGQTGDFKVKLYSEMLQSDAPLEKIITVENGQSLEASFAVSVNDAVYTRDRYRPKNQFEGDEVKENLTGAEHKHIQGEEAILKGTLTVEAAEPERFLKAGFQAKSLRDGVRFELPVRDPPLTEAFAIAGYTEENAKEMIEIPAMDAVMPYYGGLSLNLSSTALTGLSNGFDFYASNPYFCLEQKSSAYLLSITSGQLLSMFDHAPPSANDYNWKTIETLFLDSVASHQNSDGGFRLWEDSYYNRSDPYLTAYVVYIMQIMEEAADMGYDVASVPGGIYDKAVGYLNRYLMRPPLDSFLYQLETIALVNLVLTREGDSYGVTESMLLSKMDRLSLRGKGYLALAIAERKGITKMGADKRLDKLMRIFINSMKFTTDKVYFEEPRYSSYSRSYMSNGATLSVLLQTFMRLDSENQLIPQMVRAAVAEKSAPFWRDSHGVGHLSYGLWKYHNRYESEKPNFMAKIDIANKSVLEQRLKGFSESIFSYTLPMDKLAGYGEQGRTYPLSFSKEGDGRFYYNAKLLYAPAKPDGEPRDEGIEIRREIYSMSEVGSGAGTGGGGLKEVETISRGKTYLYKLTVVNPVPVYYFVLNDPLPSNVEAVNTEFKTESSSYDRFLEEQRSGGDYDSWWWMDSQTVYEYRDDRVVITKDYLSAGYHEFYYIGRGLVKGTALSPAAAGFGMYEPERFGRTGSGKQSVR